MLFSMKSHADLIGELGGAQAVADEINVKPGRVRQWKNRNFIAYQCHEDMRALAARKGVELPDDLKPKARANGQNG